MDRTALTHRRLLWVVGVLTVATLVALVLLWPRPATLPAEDADAGPATLIDGEIVAVEHFAGQADEIAGLSGEMARIEVGLLDGPDAGSEVTLEVNTDGFPEVRVGDRVALDRTTGPDGDVQYFITDFQRLPTLLVLLGLFVVTVLVISRWHGLRSLLGLGISLFIVVRFIVPAIIAGTSPPLVAFVGAMAVMVVTLYLTHGVNEMTTSAIVGTAGALVLTIGLALIFIEQGRITGFSSDDAVFARFAVEGLDLQGLVLAGLIIAALGVVDDVTISQASTVFALHDTDRDLSWTQLFTRAMKVGRDHIASVVNTLFLAYTGASIALLLLFHTGGLPITEILNTEVLAVEVIKTIVGSLGLIAAVPFTTALAASVAIGRLHDERPSDAGPPATNGPEPGTGDAGHASTEPLDDDERARRAWQRYLERHGDAGGGSPPSPGPRPSHGAGDDDGPRP
ncbi:MAG: YibE/F family protein [Nitriliruptoraceae bacterium]